MKIPGIILIAVLFPIIIHAQADSILKIPPDVLSYERHYTNTDSLISELQRQEGRQKVLTLCYTAISMFVNKDDEAENYLDWAMKLSDSLNYNQGKVMVWMVITNWTIPSGDYKLFIKSMQKAEQFLDEKTHWSLKYRVWYQIGEKYKYLKMPDSAFHYLIKPYHELNCDTAWFACLISLYWLELKAKYEGDYVNELYYLKKCNEIVMQHSKFRHFTKPNYFIAHFEHLLNFYTQHGQFKASVETIRQVLDSLRVWNFKPAVQPFLYAKFSGHLARAYHHWGKLDSAIIYHDSAMFIFNKTLNDFPGIREGRYTYPAYPDLLINIANQLEEKSGVMIKKGNFAQAKNDLLQSVTLRSENNDPLGVGMSLDKLGELFALQGDFTNARSHYDSALHVKNQFYKSHNITYDKWSASYWNNMMLESTSVTYLKLGDLYTDQDKYDLARSFYLKSLLHSRDIQYLNGEAEALNALGTNCLQRNLADSAFHFFIKSKALYQNMHNTFGVAISNTSLAYYYSYTNNLNLALDNLQEAEIHFQELEMPAKLAEIFVKQAEVFRKQHKNEAAAEKYDSALWLAIPLNIKQIMLECHLGLSEIFEESGNSHKAFSHFKNYIRLKDELFTLENNRILAEVEGLYEHEKNVTRIELLAHENELHQKQASNRKLLLLSVSGFTVVSFLLLMLFIRQNKLKVEHEKNRLHQKLLRSQLNPHFIFNALATVQNSIINEQPALANVYLTRFSKLMRNILESSAQETVNLDQELTTIENYLALQKIRYPDKFDYEITVDESLDIDNIQLPAMLIQPFVENAIEHGFRHKETRGYLQVKFWLNNSILLIEVEDNGIGRKKSGEIYQKDPKDYKSMATEIIRQRIKTLNKSMKQKITFNIFDLTNENGEPLGTRVVFEVPV